MDFWDWIARLIFGEPPPQRHIPGPPGVCAYCGRPLLSLNAEQCFSCGADWHDVTRVVFRSERGAWQPPSRTQFASPVSAGFSEVVTAEIVAKPVPQQPTPPKPKPAPTLVEYDAGAFAPLSDDEIRRRARSAGRTALWTPWFGRRDLIPPPTDQRTQLIDAGMVGHGFITAEQLVEIHRVGQQMDELRPDLALAHTVAQQAQARSDEERKRIKEQKKAESAERKRQRAAAVAHRKATDIIFLGRGVSRGLADRRSDIEKLQRLALPVLSTPADLAQALAITIPRLRWLAFHSQAVARIHYVRFTVPKKSGETRELAAPHRSLAKCQEWILRSILAKVPVHDAAHGFVAGRSTVSGAAKHVGRPVVVNADLKDFFPTITFHRVRGIFQQLGYSPAVATILGLLCTESPRRTMVYSGQKLFVATGPRSLPQGACTSPALSNLAARRLDSRLSGIAAKLGCTYTRYADDLTFSAEGEAAAKVGYLLARLRHIAQDEGFAVNEAKTRVQRRNTAQMVTGLVVNQRVGSPRKMVRRLRAILHRARTEGLAAQNRAQRPHFDAWVRGSIAYIAMCQPEQGRKLQLAYDALRHS
jgi:retron-type reverse transcriptase